MKKSDMGVEQAKEREAIVSSLTSSGWKAGASNTLYERGKSAMVEADMQYSSDAMDLSLTYHADQRQMIMGIYSKEGMGLDLTMHTQNKLETVLDLICEWQDKIAPDNYKEFVKALVKVSPKMEVDTRDTQGALISDDVKEK